MKKKKDLQTEKNETVLAEIRGLWYRKYRIKWGEL